MVENKEKNSLVNPPIRGLSFDADASYNVNRTKPDFLLRHDISDEELTMIQTGNRRFMHDVLWVSLGTFVGALAPSVAAVSRISSRETAFGILELIECLICAGGLSVFIAMLLVLKNTPSIARNIADEIRQRSAQSV